MRSTKLTPDLQHSIVASIKAGAYVETAAAAAGISKDSFYTWLKKGKAVLEMLGEAHPDQQPDITANQYRYAKFADAIQKAIAQSEMTDLAVINRAAETGAWQAAAWKLERKHHARWGRKVAITDDQGGNFFEGMAKTWATALSLDAEDSEVIDGEVVRPLLEASNVSDS